MSSNHLLKSNKKDNYSTTYKEYYAELQDNNRDYYVSEIIDFLSNYLYKGTFSFKSEDIRRLFNLEYEELITLKTVHFFLSEEVKEFFGILVYLVRNLAHSTQKKDVESKGIIKGNVNWNKTIKKRYSDGFNDNSLFICSPHLKNYDLYENQVLKFILKKFIILFEDSLNFIKLNETDLDFSKLDSEKETWYDRVNYIYHQSIFSLRNVYFNEITDVDVIEHYAVSKTFTQRNSLYHYVARVYELYEKLFILDDTECLKKLMKEQIIIVSDYDTLFELYIFSQVTQVLERESDSDSFKVGLYYANHNNAVRGKLSDGTCVKIWYQKVPEIFNKNSLYLEMTKNEDYGFKTSVRRPDLIIEIINDGKSYFRIIEVKNSSKEEYMRASFYKMLGYYTDFKGVPLAKNIPFVLVNWNGSKLNYNFEEELFKRDMIIFNKDEFIENIHNLLKL